MSCYTEMKTATVRDLRLHFPTVEGWLAEGEQVAITKSGKRIALLTKAEPVPKKTLQPLFAQRFGKPISTSEKKTNLTQLLIDDRGE